MANLIVFFAIIIVATLIVVRWIGPPPKEQDLRTNEAFQQYKQRMLDNLGYEEKSFSLWLKERDRKADQEAFDEWIASKDGWMRDRAMRNLGINTTGKMG